MEKTQTTSAVKSSDLIDKIKNIQEEIKLNKKKIEECKDIKNNDDIEGLDNPANDDELEELQEERNILLKENVKLGKQLEKLLQLENEEKQAFVKEKMLKGKGIFTRKIEQRSLYGNRLSLSDQELQEIEKIKLELAADYDFVNPIINNKKQKEKVFDGYGDLVINKTKNSFDNQEITNVFDGYAGSKNIKMSFNFTKDTINILTKISNKRGCTMTETIKRCISDEQFFLNIIEEGGKITYTDKNGKDYIVVFTP